MGSSLSVREIFRRNLAIELRKRGWSQAKLSEMSGIRAGDISNWMRGKNGLSKGNREQVADALGVTVESMLVPPAPGAYEGLFGTMPEGETY